MAAQSNNRIWLNAVFFFLFTEENCTYFGHFTPGQDSEIFEYKTQKGRFLKLVPHVSVLRPIQCMKLKEKDGFIMNKLCKCGTAGRLSLCKVQHQNSCPTVSQLTSPAAAAPLSVGSHLHSCGPSDRSPVSGVTAGGAHRLSVIQPVSWHQTAPALCPSGA